MSDTPKGPNLQEAAASLECHRCGNPRDWHIPGEPHRHGAALLLTCQPDAPSMLRELNSRLADSLPVTCATCGRIFGDHWMRPAPEDPTLVFCDAFVHLDQFRAPGVAVAPPIRRYPKFFPWEFRAFRSTLGKCRKLLQRFPGKQSDAVDNTECVALTLRQARAIVRLLEATPGVERTHQPPVADHE